MADSITTKQGKVNLLDELRVGNDICSYSNPNVRRVVYEFRKWGFPIETMQCMEPECNSRRKHVSYYYEWAREFRAENYNRHFRKRSSDR